VSALPSRSGIDLAEAARFIEALTGSADTPCTWQVIAESDRSRSCKAAVLHGPLAKVAEQLVNDNRNGCGVFVCVNETDLRGRKEENVVRVRALFVDIDKGEPPPWHLPPTIVVQSVRGPHAYWRVLDGTPDSFGANQKALAAYYGSDVSVHDLPRVMRVPGFFHNRLEPRSVDLLHANSAQVYCLVEVVGPLPGLLPAPPAGQVQSATSCDAFGSLRNRAPGEPRSPFAGIEVANRRFDLPDQIDSGTRHTTLVSYAAQLRTNGKEADEILVDLLAADRKRCRPPLQDEARGPEEIQGIAVHAGSRPVRGYERTEDPSLAALAPDGVPFFKLGSDVEIARYVLTLLEAEHGELKFDRGELWRCEEGIWRTVADHVIPQLVASLDGSLICSDAGAAKPKTQRLRVSARRQTDVAAVVRTERAAPGWFDGAGPQVVFKDVVLMADTRTKVIREETLSPLHRARVGLPMAWSRSCPAPRFEQFLDEIFKGDADAASKKLVLAEFVGVALFGLGPHFQKVLVLYGAAAAGKSVFLKVIEKLFPAGTVTSVPPQDFGDDYKGAELAGSLINLVSELPEADIMNAASFKAVVAGDLMTRRRIRKDPVQFSPRAAHIFAANSLPATSDKTDGFWRRFEVLELNNSFQGSAADPNLATAIIDRELAGVAAWAVAGAERLLRQGEYTRPPSSGVALAKWRLAADPVAQFVDEKTSPVPAGTRGTGASDLYEAFAMWALLNGFRRMSSRHFADRMRNLGHTPHKSSSNIYPLIVKR
jgi:P4 family phage/plasmid primase-like protien